MKFNCPYCNSEFISLPESLILKKCRCEVCGKDFRPIINLLDEESKILPKIKFWLEKKNVIDDSTAKINEIEAKNSLFGCLPYFLIGFFICLIFPPIGGLVILASFIMFIISIIKSDSVSVDKRILKEKMKNSKTTVDDIFNEVVRVVEIENAFEKVGINELSSFLDTNHSARFLYQENHMLWNDMKSRLSRFGFNFT